MREVGIGRVLVASLHQGISDILPTRLEFYENWLNAEGLRGGTIGVAPLKAVLSFLRQEGAAYEAITVRAGEYAADWTVDSMPSVERAFIRAMPLWARGRLVLRLMRKMVRSTYNASYAISRVRHGVASVDLHGSIFCAVRDPVPHPLCGFYTAALARLLSRFNVGSTGDVIGCRAAGDPSCALKVVLLNGRPGDQPPRDETTESASAGVPHGRG
jgi:hypothetical protein